MRQLGEKDEEKGESEAAGFGFLSGRGKVGSGARKRNGGGQS